MNLRHLIILLGLLGFVACTQEINSQDTNSTSLFGREDPRIKRFHNDRIERPNWPHHARPVRHGPEVFRKMRPVEEQSDLHRQRQVFDVVTESPASVAIEMPVEKSAEEPKNDAPSKMIGGVFKNKLEKDNDLLVHPQSPWNRMHSGPLMRHPELWERNEPQMTHFSAGTVPVATDNSQTLTSQTKPESTESQFLPRRQRQETSEITNLENNSDAKTLLRNRFVTPKTNVVTHEFAEADHVNDREDIPHFHRGHFPGRFSPRGGPQEAMLNIPNNRETVIRMVNRPPDIIIRNTFQDRPKSFIDLRLTIDDNGVLNVEAGPQGIVRNSTTSNVNQVASHVEDDDFLDLEDHWMRNRPMRDVHQASGLHEQEDFDRFPHGPVRDKRIPFWLLRGPNPRFGHGPFPDLAENENHETRSGRSQNLVSGASSPPHIPKEEMQGPVEQDSDKKEESENSHKIGNVSKLGGDNSDLIVSGVIQEATLKTPNESLHANDQEEINPVVNIDDFASSGCPNLSCNKNCPGELRKLDQSNGCPMCECCPEIACRSTCPNGFESDQFGCPICRCA